MLRHTRFAFGAAQFVPRVKKPNHFLTRAWSFAVFARKLSLQALWQKRRPQWWWLTRPNFPPQFAQRLFSNLVMTLSRQRGDEFRWRRLASAPSALHPAVVREGACSL